MASHQDRPLLIRRLLTEPHSSHAHMRTRALTCRLARTTCRRWQTSN